MSPHPARELGKSSVATRKHDLLACCMMTCAGTTLLQSGQAAISERFMAHLADKHPLLLQSPAQARLHGMYSD